MARSTRLLILIKSICALWGRKRFLLLVTCIPRIQYTLSLYELNHLTGVKVNVAMQQNTFVLVIPPIVEYWIRDFQKMIRMLVNVFKRSQKNLNLMYFQFHFLGSKVNTWEPQCTSHLVVHTLKLLQCNCPRTIRGDGSR